MWNNPNKIIEKLNELYNDEGWHLKFVKELNNGHSRGFLFICQTEPNFNYVIVKSFDNKHTASLERKNNLKARRQFDLPFEVLTEVVEFDEGNGACFCMQLAGGGEGQSFSGIIQQALETGDPAPAAQVINLISTKLRRSVPTPMTKHAFTHIHFDDNLYENLQKLDPKLYIQFREWWQKKRSSTEHRAISFAPAHGDLHADNIFVLKTDNLHESDVHLIDFGCFGEYPILKDFARLECDIRFRLLEIHLPNKEDAAKLYLKQQEQITKLSLNQENIFGREYIDNLEDISSIPSNLHNSLRTTLLECGSFNTVNELRAIFVDERLSPWRNRLPEADNITVRVERTIEFLHNQYNNVGENALVLLLDVLSERLDPTDDCHPRLANLASRFVHDLTNRNDARFESTEQRGLVPSQDLNAPLESLKGVVELIRIVKKCARDSIGGDTSFEYDYICFLEFLFFAAIPGKNKSKLQRIGAFKEAMSLAKRLDDYYLKDEHLKENGVLWRLAYAFLRLEQLPSGAWARSLPSWMQTLLGDSEESRSKGFGLRQLGGMNLTGMAMLNYARTLWNVLGKNPEAILNQSQEVENYKESLETKQFLDSLRQIEMRNQVCSRIVPYIHLRINTEGAIPASELVREVDTEVHHTLLGIIILLLAYILSGRTLYPELYNDIIVMCEYLDLHGSRVKLRKKRWYEIYCALVFLEHLVSYKFFETIDPGVDRAIQSLPITLERIRSQITGGGGAYLATYPVVPKGTSGFLMNLPLLFNLSGSDLLEKNRNFTYRPLDQITFDTNGLVECKMGGKLVSDWGHTAEYWWAKIRLDGEMGGAHYVLKTLNAQLINQDVLSLTHGVSFSYVLGLCLPPKLSAFHELDEQINKVLQTVATERNLLSLITWIFHQEYQDFPLLKQDLVADRSLLETIPRGHKLFPVANELKNLFISKLQPGDYIPVRGSEQVEWQSIIKNSIEDTKSFFEDDLGERNNENCAQLLPNKKWLHLFNYLGHRAVTDEARVLDVGCGSGVHALKEFIPKGYRVHFFDCSKRVLMRIKDQLKEKGIDEDHKTIEGNIESLSNPYAFKRRLLPGYFKVIFADAVLFHVTKGKVPGILNRFHEILADDGFLFANFKVNDHTLIGIDGRLFEFYTDHWEIRKMFEDANFFVEDVTLTKKNASMYGSPYTTYWAHFICSKENTN